MPVFAVDSEAMQATQASAQASSDRVRAEVAGLMANLLALQDTWFGQASAGFRQQVEVWQATQRIVEDNLDSLNASLYLTLQAYTETENAAIALFR